MKRSAAESVAFTARTTAAARQNLTPAHRALWNALRLTPGWHCEYNVIGTTKNGGRFPYRLDLYHPATRLAIEVDGGIHACTRGRDRRRDGFICGKCGKILLWYQLPDGGRTLDIPQ